MVQAPGTSNTNPASSVARNGKQTKPRAPLGRRIFFTANYENVSQDKAETERIMRKELENFEKCIKENPDSIFLASAWEEYGEAGNPHIHGLIHTIGDKYKKNVQSWQKQLKLFGINVNAHVDLAKETAGNSNVVIINYRNKEGKKEKWQQHHQVYEENRFFLFQSVEGQLECSRGSRTDIRGALDKCTNMSELVLQFPEVAAKGMVAFSRYYYLKQANQPARYFDTKAIWIYGDSGSGKSYACEELAKNITSKRGEHYWRHNSGSLKWWDGYSGQEVVIIEEFRRDRIKEGGGLAQLLILLDKYTTELPIKGGFTARNFHTIIINTF